MPISFACSCGKSYTVGDELAGKRTRCPACKATLEVPQPAEEPADAGFELVADDEPDEAGDAPSPFTFADQPAAVAAPAPEPADADESATPRYFTVAHDSKLIPKLYRIYPDGDQLLMLYAGPFNWNLVDQVLASSPAGGTVAPTAGSPRVVVGGPGLGGFAATAMVNWVDGKKLAGRAAELDGMSVEQLREEAGRKGNLLLTAGSLSEVLVGEPEESMWLNKAVQDRVTANLKFKHQPSGKWWVYLLTAGDAKAAVRGLRAALGKGNVEVTYRSRKKRD